MKTLESYLQIRYPIELVADEGGGYFAKHPDLDGCFAQGETADEAVRSLEDARKLWIASRLEDGLSVPEPLTTEPSGRFLVRTMPRVHAELAQLAQRQGVSLNQLVNVVLAEHIGRAPFRDVLLQVHDRYDTILALLTRNQLEPSEFVTGSVTNELFANVPQTSVGLPASLGVFAYSAGQPKVRGQ